MRKKIIATIVVAIIANIIIIYQFYISQYGINIIDNIKNITVTDTNIGIIGIKIIIMAISTLLMTKFLIKLYQRSYK